MGLKGCERHEWVHDKLRLIDRGQVRRVISTFKRYCGKGQQRIANLHEYLERFSDAVHYEKFLVQGFPIGSGRLKALTAIFPKSAWLVGEFLDSTSHRS